MVLCIKSLLLKSDFIGFTPQLRIFEETRYTSVFSSILSIVIIMFSVAFVFYSFLDYLNQNPSIHYYKNNDLITNKTYTLSNSLFMFDNFFICISDNDSDSSFYDYNLTISAYELNHAFFEGIEPCELGKKFGYKI